MKYVEIGLKEVLVDAADVFLDTIIDTVSGPMSNVLGSIAKGVNTILKSIPLVVREINLESTLSAFNDSGVALKIEYSFLNEDHTLELVFRFNIGNTAAILGDFCKEIANKLLGLVTGGRRRVLAPGLPDEQSVSTYENLEGAANMVEEIGKELTRESKEEELAFEYEMVELKQQLLRAEDTMVASRAELLEQQNATIEEEKILLKNIQQITSKETQTGGAILMASTSREKSFEINSNLEIMESLLAEIEEQDVKEMEHLKTFTLDFKALMETM